MNLKLIIYCMILFLFKSALGLETSSFRIPELQNWYLHRGYSKADFLMVSDGFKGDRSVILVQRVNHDSIHAPKKSTSQISSRTSKGFPYVEFVIEDVVKSQVQHYFVFRQAKGDVLFLLSSSKRQYRQNLKDLLTLRDQFEFNNTKFSLYNFAVPRAQAVDCLLPDQSQSSRAINIIYKTSQEKILETMINCGKSMIDGVWDSTGGQLNSTMECLNTPLNCAQKTVQEIKNIYLLMESLRDRIMELSHQLSSEDLTNLSCNLSGSLGTDFLLSVATTGMGSGKSLKTLSEISTKILSLSKILKVTGRLHISIEKLSKYKIETLDKISKMIESGQIHVGKLEAIAMACSK